MRVCKQLYSYSKRSSIDISIRVQFWGKYFKTTISFIIFFYVHVLVLYLIVYTICVWNEY